MYTMIVYGSPSELYGKFTFRECNDQEQRNPRFGHLLRTHSHTRTQHFVYASHALPLTHPFPTIDPSKDKQGKNESSNFDER